MVSQPGMLAGWRWHSWEESWEEEHEGVGPERGLAVGMKSVRVNSLGTARALGCSNPRLSKMGQNSA